MTPGRLCFAGFLAHWTYFILLSGLFHRRAEIWWSIKNYGLDSHNYFALWTEQVGLIISTPAVCTDRLHSSGTNSILLPHVSSATDDKNSVDVRGRPSLSVNLPPRQHIGNVDVTCRGGDELPGAWTPPSSQSRSSRCWTFDLVFQVEISVSLTHTHTRRLWKTQRTKWSLWTKWTTVQMRMKENKSGQVQAEEQTCLCDKVTFPLRNEENGEETEVDTEQERWG